MQLLKTLNEQAKEVELIHSDHMIFEKYGFDTSKVVTYKTLLEVSAAAVGRAGERDWISDLAKDKDIYKPQQANWRSSREDMVDFEQEPTYKGRGRGENPSPQASDLVILPGGRLTNITRVDGVDKDAIYPSGIKVTIKIPTGIYVVDSSKLVASPRKSAHNPDRVVWALAK